MTSGLEPARGFTLLEVLVVLFIMAFAAALVVVTLPPDDERLLNQQANQLLEDFAFARDLALHRHRLVGWHPTTQGYQFSLYNQGQWVPYTSRALPQRSWLDGVQLQGVEIQGVETQGVETQAPPLMPALVFFPSGEVTPATLTLKRHETLRPLERF